MKALRVHAWGQPPRLEEEVEPLPFEDGAAVLSQLGQRRGRGRAVLVF